MIYLDNSATTRPFDSVLDAVSACYKEDFYNINCLTKIGDCSIGQGVFINNKELKYKGYNHFE